MLIPYDDTMASDILPLTHSCSPIEVYIYIYNIYTPFPTCNIN